MKADKGRGEQNNVVPVVKHKTVVIAAEYQEIKRSIK